MDRDNFYVSARPGRDTIRLTVKVGKGFLITRTFDFPTEMNGVRLVGSIHEATHAIDAGIDKEKAFDVLYRAYKMASRAHVKNVIVRTEEVEPDTRNRFRSALCRLNNVASLFGPKTRKVLKKLIGDQERYIIELVEAGKPKTARWQVFVTWLYLIRYAIETPIKYGVFGWITSWVKSHISG